MMLCPVDQTQLAISNRQGIEIDYCPTCRGVWLDRGELDKLVERESQFTRGYDDRDRRGHDEDRRYEPERREGYRDDRRRYDDDDDHHGHHKKHKKEGLLGDLFDFG